jgi:hypothetical protein
MARVLLASSSACTCACRAYCYSLQPGGPSVALWLCPAWYIPLGYVRSGCNEGLVKSSVCLLLLMWKNISETRKQVGEVDVVTTLDLPVHIGKEP